MQELLDTELDVSLGYEKKQKGGVDTSNKRNGRSAKNLLVCESFSVNADFQGLL